MTQKNQNFSMFSGDTKDLIVAVTDNGQAIDLAGSSIKWAMKRSVRDVQSIIQKETGGGGIVASSSSFTVRLNSEDTENVVPGRYYHEAEITDVVGNVSTVMTGTITIEQSGV